MLAANMELRANGAQVASIACPRQPLPMLISANDYYCLSTVGQRRVAELLSIVGRQPLLGPRRSRDFGGPGRNKYRGPLYITLNFLF